jgi:ABC-2 type transport system ATP-binding protein
MIRVSDLTKIYGRTEAIRDVSFHVEKGEILGLLGPNGSGKTTTMRILTCHTPPTRGTVLVAGYDVTKNSLSVRRKIGYMPETIGLYEDMTVLSYLIFMAEVKGLDRGQRSRQIPQILEQTGLARITHRLIRNLSRGFRQRVGLAQALVGDPDILILDEPTVGLDPAQIKEVRTLISSMRGSKTILLSTHILPEVTAVCSRIAIISLGRIRAVGTPENLAASLSLGRRLAVLAGGDRAAIRHILKNIPGVIKITEHGPEEEDKHLLFHLDVEKDRDIRGAISASLLKAGCELYELYPTGISLEDLYMKVVMGEA